LVKHNGYKLDGHDTWLEGALAFLKGIPAGDTVVFITSRTPAYKETTEQFLSKYGIRYDFIIYGAPSGERRLLNDRKPSGLETAVAVNPRRDCFSLRTVIDPRL
jgi:hypothetical protein